MVGALGRWEDEGRRRKGVKLSCHTHHVLHTRKHTHGVSRTQTPFSHILFCPPGQKIIEIYDVSLDFRDRIIKVAFGNTHLVLASAAQCYVYCRVIRFLPNTIRYEYCDNDNDKRLRCSVPSSQATSSIDPNGVMLSI